MLVEIAVSRCPRAGGVLLPRGVIWTRQSVRHYDGKVVPGKDPMGRAHYWFTVVPIESAEEVFAAVRARSSAESPEWESATSGTS